MGIEDIVVACERAQERQYEAEQQRKAQKEAALQAGAEKWAREFLAIDVELAADKAHVLDLIDAEMGTSLTERGFDEVYKLLALDAAGERYER